MTQIMDEVCIREAERRDVEAMTALLSALFAIEQDFTPDPVRQRRGLLRLLDEPGAARLFVAERGERVLGLCAVHRLFSTAEGAPVGLVEDVIVAEDARGTGVGRRLLCHAETWAARQGMTRLQLLVDADNAPALTFYKRLGWSPTRLVCRRKGLSGESPH